MGRPLRTRIDFAKTLSWYDFFHNQLIAFGKIKNDFGLAKLLCKDTEKVMNQIYLKNISLDYLPHSKNGLILLIRNVLAHPISSITQYGKI
jgi:hypothetical protein